MEKLWKEFSKEGKILMNLDKYPFSEKYGWIQDKFGVSWQLNLSVEGNKINPFLMFVQERNGKAEEAIKYYTSIFINSKVDKIERYPKGEKNEGKVIHASFLLYNQEFMAMDGGKEHNFNFTPAISYYINCENQEEVDNYWEKLSKDGEKGQCGWLKDKFGISWQIVPTELIKLINDPDNKKSESVMKAMMKMTKLDIAELKNAYEHSS
jgi:predicted 3-demethylubiquinone-9 3-methyltransferase (glyoxalase superfamily)